MPSIVVDDFRFGMDRRRKRVAGLKGTVWNIENGHLTRGGDIERAKKFVPVYTLPQGTRSLSAVRGQLYTYGSADIGNEVPLGVQYQRLEAPNAPTLEKILDVKPFGGKNYVIAEYDDGNIYHFYNAVRVSDWDSFVVATPEAVAARLAEKVNASEIAKATAFGAVITITARTPGTGFSIGVTSIDGGADSTEDITATQLQANVSAVTEVLATGTVTITAGSSGSENKITSITVNGVEVLSGEAAWTSSNASTAIVVAGLINNNEGGHGYTASVADAVITLTAGGGTGATPNGYEIVVTTSGDVSASSTTVVGGVDEVVPVAQVERVEITGTVEIEDTFAITLDSTSYRVTGLASGMGTSAFVHKQRVFSAVGSLRRYCSLNDPTIWDPLDPNPDADAGQINISTDTEGNAVQTGASVYQGQAAFFSGDLIALYDLDVDPDNFAFADSLENTGTIAAGTIVRYGNNDVFYYDYSGVRSIQSRDGTVAPYVTDAGSPVDPFIKEYVATLTQQQVLDAKSVIDPEDGRLWVAIGARIFVLSRFADSGISGWSYYSPGFEVDAFARVGNRLYARAGDTVYLYGGESGQEYPAAEETPIRVGLPFLMGRGLADFKEFTGFDLAATNTWEVNILYDPNNEERTFPVGTIAKVTFNEMDISAAGPAACLAPSLVCDEAGPATISSMMLHYDVTKSA